jgi:DNA-binding beta-propeller fold protein YncE/Mg-chelatase subunit ChlD
VDPNADLALVYSQTLGESEVPWFRSAAQLNQPWGLDDEGDAVWIGEAAGKRALKFSSSGRLLDELGRAGLGHAIYNRPVRFIADIVAYGAEGEQGGNGGGASPTAEPTKPPQPPIRPLTGAEPQRLDQDQPLVPMIWFVDRDAHVAVGIVRSSGAATVLGTHDEAGDDDQHFDHPTGIAVGADGRVYVSDTGNHRVQIFDGATQQLLGTIGRGRPGSGAGEFNLPARLNIDDEGLLYVADAENHRVLAFDVSDPAAPAQVRSYGTGTRGAGDDQLSGPQGLATDASFVYIADTGNCRVQVWRRRQMTFWRSLTGFCDASTRGYITDVARDARGFVYVADAYGMQVHQLNPDWSPLRVFGSLDRPYLTDNEHYNAPVGVAVGADDAIYVLEQEGGRLIRKAADGSIDWVFGKPGDPIPAPDTLNMPGDVAVDSQGRVYVAETGEGLVARLAPDGSFDTHVAQDGQADGQVDSPAGLSVAADDRLVIADTGNHRVQILAPDGSHLATLGQWDAPGTAPGRFRAPQDALIDGRGRLWVADTGNQRVERFDAGFNHELTLGYTGQPGDDFEHFDGPTRLAVDAQDRLYVADTGNNRVQVFDAEGRYLTTVGGRWGDRSGGLREPYGLAVSAGGRLFVADSQNHRVQGFSPADEPWTARNINGFEYRSQAAVSALAEFGGALLAGTWDPERGLSILRRGAPDQAWQLQLEGGDGDADKAAVMAFQSFKGALYAGILDEHVDRDPATGQLTRSSEGGAIWRSDDGQRWQPVAEAGLGDVRNAGFGSFTEYGGQLYVGTRSIDPAQAAELWRSTTGDSGSWERTAQLGFDGDLGNRAVGALGVFTDTLWAGTCHTGQPEIWQSKDGKRWTAGGVTGAAGIGTSGTGCVSALLGYENYFYAAVSPDARLGTGYRAGEVWRCKRCDAQDWEQVAPAGIGNASSRGRIALAVFDEPPFRYLYAAVGNESHGLDIWRAPDGLAWEQVSVGGLGDSNNSDLYGGSAFATWHARLHLGTVNAINGGELWSSGGTRPGSLPTPAGPRPTPTPRPRPAPPVGRAAYELVDQWPPGQVIAPDVIGTIQELAVADDGTVLLLDATNNRVMRLNPDGSWGTAFGNIGRGPSRIGQVGAFAVDGVSHRVYVTDIASERLLVFGLDGSFIDAWPEISALGLEVQPDGSLWIADRLAGAARHLDAAGLEIERFGSFGYRDEDQFSTLTDLTMDPAGNLWVLDVGVIGNLGVAPVPRIRGFRPEGGNWRRFRTIDLTAVKWQGCVGAEQRITALGPERLLADGCIIDGNQRADAFPANHRSADLYGVTRRTANAGAGHYVALATYDTDRDDPENPTFPAVVRYFDEGFDIVVRYSLGRNLDAAQAAADGAVSDAVRLSTAPDGSLMVTDQFGLRQRGPAGDIRDDLPLSPYPSRINPLRMAADLTVGEGRDSRIMGVGLSRAGRFGRQVVVYAKTVYRRYCRNQQCQINPYLEVIWDTTLPTQTEGIVAVAHEPVGNQFAVLTRYNTAPATRGVEAISYQMLVYPLDQYGRKTILQLSGEDRDAIWADVDAGPGGRIYVLDTLNDRVQVYASDLTDLGMVATPKDAWRVAGGPNNEIFVLTVYGHVVRMAADGTILSRFVARPHEGVPPTSLVDLTVDKDGWVYTVDALADQVTVFAPEGSEDEVLQGDNCQLGGDKWADPRDILLGDATNIYLSLFGTCGFVEQPADIILAVNTLGNTLGDDPGRQLANNLRRARQIAALTDLDRHRIGVVSFSRSGEIDQRLTGVSYELVRALRSVRADAGTPPRNYAALRTARDLFEPKPERMRVIVLVTPGEDDAAGLALAEELKAEGVRILIVNGTSVIASGDLFNNITVDPRAMGAGKEVHRRMLSRDRPEIIVQRGTLTDVLPANMAYVAGSARPAAVWDAAARSLTWSLVDLDIDLTHTFQFQVRPSEEGEWPTNVRARAEVTDGWGHAAGVDYPIPRVRVYGELPTPTATATATSTPTLTPTRTPTPTITPIPEPIFLPLLLKTVCGDDTRNADVALVIDTSGSMGDPTSAGGPTKLEAAREAARSFLGQLVAGRDQAAIVQFNSEASVVVPLTDDPALAIAGLANLSQASGTNIGAALALGTQVLTGPERRRDNNAVLILLTDGDPTVGTAEELAAASAASKAAGLLVFTIGLGEGLDQDLLRGLATQPAWFFSAPDTSQLAAIYAQIAFALPCKPGWP